MLKRFIANVLEYSGLLTIIRHIGNRRVTILNYHKISPASHALMSDTWSATPVQFEKQMIYLKNHYNILSAEQFISCFEKKRFKRNSVMITLDDGEIENYTYVYPILKKHRIPAVFFITTDYVGSKEHPWWDRLSLMILKCSEKQFILKGNGAFRAGTMSDKKETIKKLKMIFKKLPADERTKKLSELASLLKVDIKNSKRLFLSWDELKIMHKNNMAIEPHSVTHPILSNENKERINWEIKTSKENIEKRLNKKCRFFCYPNGHLININNDVKEALKNNGIDYAFTTVLGDNDTDSDRLQLKRICIAKDFAFSVFKVEITGIFNILRGILWKQK